MTLAQKNAAALAANFWMQQVLCRPYGLAEVPRGLPLCRLRITAEDNVALADLLRRHLRPGTAAPARLAALFCLFAADTLRRRPQGGAWSWQTVTWPLGASDLPRTELWALVDSGLKFWRRPLHRSAGDDRLFLHSLLFESGIPTPLLNRLEFVDFLRQTQRDLDRYGATSLEAVSMLAGSNAHRLPGSWRNPDTLALAGELLHALQPVRDALLRRNTALLAGPLADWRDRLPLDMAEAVAEQLVQNLLRQEKSTDRPLRELGTLCGRVLVRRGDGWIQGLAPTGPGLLPARIATGIPFVGPDIPDRVRVHVEGLPFAIAEYQGHGRWTYRPTPSRPPELDFDRAADARLIVDGQERERLTLPGGDPLDNLPWVLEADEDAPDRLTFVRQGSHNTPGETLFLAVDPAQGGFEIRSGSVTEYGAVFGTARIVHRVTGEVLWRERGEPYALRLRTSNDLTTQPQIAIDSVAPRWPVLAGLVSLGQPQVAVQGQTRTARLIWRLRRGATGWAPLSGELPPGECDVALTERGDILDRRRLVILPPDASISIRPLAQGVELHISGLGEVAAALPEYPAAGSGERHGGSTILRAFFDSLPPGHVLVRTRMPDGLDLLHHIRVPMAAGGFLGSDGHVLPQNAVISFPDLKHMRARAGAGDDRAELAATIRLDRVPRRGVRA